MLSRAKAGTAEAIVGPSVGQGADIRIAGPKVSGYMYAGTAVKD